MTVLVLTTILLVRGRTFAGTTSRLPPRRGGIWRARKPVRSAGRLAASSRTDKKSARHHQQPGSLAAARARWQTAGRAALEIIQEEVAAAPTKSARKSWAYRQLSEGRVEKTERHRGNKQRNRASFSARRDG